MAVVTVVVVSIFVVAIGVVGLVSAEGMRWFVSLWRSGPGLWAAAIFRLVFGTALWLAAPSSRTPVALQALGVLSIVSAIVLPLVGFSRFDALLAWWSGRSPLFIRVWSGVALVLGSFVVWSVVT